MLCPHVLAVVTITRKGHKCLPGWEDSARVLPVPLLFGLTLVSACYAAKVFGFVGIEE
jgi:hypothetical protein